MSDTQADTISAAFEAMAVAMRETPITDRPASLAGHLQEIPQSSVSAEPPAQDSAGNVAVPMSGQASDPDKSRPGLCSGAFDAGLES